VAQTTLGTAYLVGTIVPENRTEGIKWLRKAAEQGYAVAQFQLGRQYDAGDFIPRDREEAIKWIRKAAEQGFERAVERLREIEERLGESQ
jgi:hypothetical protein